MILNGLDVLNERAMSSYPVSIGTSLALESFELGPNEPYDKERQIPNKVNLSDYNYFYINVHTLYRNMVGAVNSLQSDKLMIDDKYFILHQEIERIKDIVNYISKGNIKLVFYFSRYKDMDKVYPNAILRKPTTEKQIIYNTDMIVTVEHVLKDFPEIEVFNREFKPNIRSKVLIMTHYPFDLLEYKNFDKFDLLESHTGVLKTPSMFYTKLLNGKDLNRIQFNNLSIQVFGDKETFSPMSIKIKKLILDLAEKYNWTQATTKDRFFYCINTIEDQEIRNLLKSLVV